jgi:formylglycine-generating enzyme required for sulfatase activity
MACTDHARFDREEAPETVATVQPKQAPPFPGMVWIPGGTFRMGSKKHYPEVMPVHGVSVVGFLIDR